MSVPRNVSIYFSFAPILNGNIIDIFTYKETEIREIK